MTEQEKRTDEGLIESLFHENYDRAVEVANDMQRRTNELKEKLLSVLTDFTEQSSLRNRTRQVQKLFAQIRAYQVEDLLKTATEAGNKAFGKLVSMPSDDERIPVISRVMALADITRLNTIEIGNLVNQIKSALGGAAEKAGVSKGRKTKSIKAPSEEGD